MSLTPSLPYMTEISVVIRHVTEPFMKEIPVGFTIVTPGSLDPGMHFGLEVKWLRTGYDFFLQPPCEGRKKCSRNSCYGIRRGHCEFVTRLLLCITTGLKNI